MSIIGLVASEADPQLVYQQPSYVYPGGHPVYRMAGFPYAYPVYEQPAVVPLERAGSSIASGPVFGEIVKDFKPAPSFYSKPLKSNWDNSFLETRSTKIGSLGNHQMKRKEVSICSSPQTNYCFSIFHFT